MRQITIALTLALSLVACAPVLSALPTVISAVVDGVQILDMIAQHADLVLAQTNADAATKAKVHEALARARAALNAALRAAQGAEQAGNLDQASAEAAFAAFKEAYLALLEVVRPLGVRESGDMLSARASFSGTTLMVPRPEAFRLQVKRAG
jgi:hypothetical protein